MLQQSQLEKREDGVFVGGNLWRVGFHIRSIGLIQNLSGLVDIHEVVFLQEHATVVLVVSNKDKTGTLFGEGSLQGAQIPGFQPHPQGLGVEWPNNHSSTSGGN